jgi:NADPH-dependent F420 reductase
LNIGFISGTGNEGKALALRFGMNEHTILIGSRNKDKSDSTVVEIKSILNDINIHGFNYQDTAKNSDVIFLALPYTVVENTVLDLKEELKGKLVIDTSVPMIFQKGKFTRDPNIPSSVSENLSNILINSMIVSSFHTISHTDLNKIDHELDHDLLYFVNEENSESIFLELINTVKGLNPIKCGTLDLSLLIESQVPLLLNINKNYNKSTSLKIKGL